MSGSDSLRAEARRLLPDAIALRRDLHACPELGNHLPKTRERVLRALAPLGLEVVRSEATSSFVATIRGGRPGPCVLLRADMDALPMPEDTGLEFASRSPGAMHACGHDAHTAMLVGAAHLLSARRAKLAGDVKLFFQSGEEGHFGARLCLEEGLLEHGRAPEGAFALHVDALMPVGRVAGRAGPMLASVDRWRMELTGRGGHASMPHDAVDPIPAACEIVTGLQTMVTRRVHAQDPCLLYTSPSPRDRTRSRMPSSA